MPNSLLFFHDIGMPPLWVVILWLGAFLACPVFFIKGAYALFRERSNNAFMYTFAVLFAVALVYHILWIFIRAEIGFFAFMTIPFGIGAVPVLAIIGLPMFFVNLLAIAVNFVAVYGAVGIIEKLIGKMKKN